ncbi:MAG: tRNA pseudouridine(38-40) synthase TruA [Nitrospirae bacterium]|nr:tRNA pseudouridine(38-40) synthase TruA [Nitrospirota bacterium]
MTDSKNIKLIIEYDGTGYHGWQHQPRHINIQQTIKEKIETIAKEKINLIGASRTDAGVHAIAQVANFKTKSRMNEGEWQRALNSLLPSDIVIKKTEVVPPDFHARFSAKGKIYKYLILNQPVPSALYRNYAWHIPYPLKVNEMRKAAKSLIGRHDFSSFRASSCSAENPVRRIKRLVITKIPSYPPLVKGGRGDYIDNFIQIVIEADAFLHHMVRNIIGTLIEVGTGKLLPSRIDSILKAKDRRLAGKTAPPHGLYLVKVIYK